MSTGILILVAAFWMMFQFQRHQLEKSNTTVIMAKDPSHTDDQPGITSGHDDENTDNRPPFGFQLIEKPEISFFNKFDGGMTMIFRPSTAQMDVLANSIEPLRPTNLNIVQW